MSWAFKTMFASEILLVSIPKMSFFFLMFIETNSWDPTIKAHGFKKWNPKTKPLNEPIVGSW